MTLTTLEPIDAANARTIAQGHPPGHSPPQAKAVYDLLVIGGGPAGLTAAFAAREAGHTVALVERNLTGGTCVNFGCTPSKALIRAARAVHQARDGQRFGYRLADAPRVDFAAVMGRVRDMRAAAGASDSVAAAIKAGIDVWLGEARFASPDTVAVDGQTLRFSKALIASGSTPVLPDVPGLAGDAVLTNETIFELTAQPGRLVCLGGGAINCELAQAFCRLCSHVELIGSADRLLPGEVADASALLARRLAAEGVRLHLGVEVRQVDAARRRITLSDGTTLDYDAVLVASGRRPRVDDLNLQAAGVSFGSGGVEADDHLRTANPNVFAAGDAVMREKFTHAAVATATLALHNALGGATPRSVRDLVIPRCTYTDPEVAHVGATPAEAAKRGIEVETHRLPMAEVERARLDGETEGFIELSTHDGTIIGATMVSSHAGETIPLLTAAVMQRMRPAALADIIACYPTQAQAVQSVAASAAAAGK